MKKVLFLFMFQLSCLSTVFSQNYLANSPYNLSNGLTSVPSFNIQEKLTVRRYWASKAVDEIEYVPIKKFNKSQLESPKQLLQAMYNCNSLSWHNSLSIKKETKPNYNEKYFEARTTESFVKNYYLEVIAEMYCLYKGKEYCSLLYRHKYIGDFYRTVTVTMEKRGENWFLSPANDVSKFSMFMYVKPKYFVEMLGHRFSGREFINKYFYRGNFFIDSDFAFSMVFSMGEERPFPMYTIENGVGLKLKRDVFSELNVTVNLVKTLSKSSGALIEYDKERFNFGGDHDYREAHTTHPEYQISKYDSIPELALASWHYSKDSIDKKEHCIGYSYVQKDVKRWLSNTMRYGGRIDFLYKLVFYDDETMYTLIYFSEWYKSPIPNSLGNKGPRWIGEKSALLKWDDGEWKLVFDTKLPIMNAVRAFDKLSLRGMQILFKGDGSRLTGVHSHDVFFNGGAIAQVPDKRIVINFIPFITKYYNNQVPRELRRKWNIRGLQDSKEDQLLPYWMDRTE